MASFKNYYPCLLLLIVFGVFFMSCSNGSSLSGGTTTETTNGIVAFVYDEDGNAVKNCKVLLRPSDYTIQSNSQYIDNEVQDKMTDSIGKVIFNISVDGYYAITAISEDIAKAIFIDSIQVDSNSLEITIKKNLNLLPFGAIAGFLENEKIVDYKISFRGTDLTYDVKSDSLFIITSVPKGLFSVLINSNNDSVAEIKSLVAESIDTVFSKGLSSGYKGFKRINLNTSESGINISEDVTNFPLLVRLDSSNPKDSIIFNNVKNYNSLKILDNDNQTEIPYAIERWDNATDKSAELWMKVPVIDGANESGYVTILYGKESNIDTTLIQSDIFDNIYGYSGVWHLQEENGLALFDNSNIGNTASKKSQGSPAPYPSIIGFGQRFDGIADQIILENSIDYVSGNDVQTIELWVFPELLQGTLLSYSGTYQALEIGIDSSGFIFINAIRDDTSNYDTLAVKSTRTVDLDSWTHISVSIENINDSIECYINGEKSSVKEFSTIVELELNSAVFYGTIGSSQNDTNYFKGIIDELRFYRGRLSSAWHKINYDCQKKDPKLFQGQ